MFERPSTTAFLPSIVTPLRSNNSIHPCGVHDTWKSNASNANVERPGACVPVLAN
jgi:hypothetical protein